MKPSLLFSIRAKLILAFGLAFLLVFFTVLLYSLRLTHGLMESRVRADAMHQAQAMASAVDNVLTAASRAPMNMAGFLETVPVTGPELLAALHKLVKENPEVFGATAAFEPFGFRPDRKYYAPYYYRNPDTLSMAWLGSSAYDYFFLDWYQVPHELEKPVWSEPYFDESGGGIIMCTYSVPFYRNKSGNRRLAGIVTADISLEWLEKSVADIHILKSGFAFLISHNGTVITHSQANLVMNETVFSIAEANDDTGLSVIGRRMIRGESGFEQPKENALTGRDAFLAFVPVPHAGWSLGVVYPRREILADVNRLRGIATVLGLFGLAFMLVCVYFIALSITRPLRALAAASSTIAAGNLSAPLPRVRSRDEVGALADSFAHMRDSLKEQIRNVSAAAAARERVDGEFRLARSIQADILPHVFPAFPDRGEFELFATMKPAREVGGDFYDFFLIDDNLLLIAVGDVSDKGTAAALFMAMAVTVIRTAATSFSRPADIVTFANRALCRGNETCMFATLFVAVLDIRKGTLVYTDAGHNLPLLTKAGRKEPQRLAPSQIFSAVGLDDGIVYRSESVALESGDLFVLYTDGITEAFNSRKEMFGEERLISVVGAHAAEKAEAVVNATIAEVVAFSGDAPQSDDLALLVLRYNGPSPGKEAQLAELFLNVKADPAAIPEAQASAEEFLSRNGCGPDIVTSASICIEEVLVNTVGYGYDFAAGHVMTVRISLADAGGSAAGRILEMRFEDDAKPFNPLLQEPPDLGAPVEERVVGGLGIHIIRSLTDDARYERLADKNILFLRKRLPADPNGWSGLPRP